MPLGSGAQGTSSTPLQCFLRNHGAAYFTASKPSDLNLQTAPVRLRNYKIRTTTLQCHYVADFQFALHFSSPLGSWYSKRRRMGSGLSLPAHSTEHVLQISKPRSTAQAPDYDAGS